MFLTVLFFIIIVYDVYSRNTGMLLIKMHYTRFEVNYIRKANIGFESDGEYIVCELSL